MLSIGSRDGRKRLGLEMEVEEGEALSYNNNSNNDGFEEDPDIALSYIEEKIQSVLGHFQKDFEGGVLSAENLGAKFGGYGSFLPTYQRSPSWSHAKSQQEIHSSDSPRKLHLEDHRQNSLAQSSASPSLRPCDASGRTSPTGNSLKSDVYLPSRHAEEPVPKSGVVMKPVNSSDHRSLKVRLKVGPETLSTQKNVDIYSGLGLVSPSSSLDDSPSTSEQQCGKVSDAPDESPFSILEIMTFAHSVLLLSPLAEDLIHLTEKRKHKVKSESGAENNLEGIESLAMSSNGFHANTSNQKVKERKISKSSEKYDAVSNKTSYQKNYADQKDTGYLLKKEQEPDINALGYEELVSNALKLPLLLSPHDTADNPAKVMSTPTNFPVIDPKEEKKQLHSESLQNIGIIEKMGGRTGFSSKVAVSKKGNTTDNAATAVPFGQQDVLKIESDLFKQQVLQKGGRGSEEDLNSAPENSSTGGKKKPKRAKETTAQYSHTPDNRLVADFSVTSKREKSSKVNGILFKPDSRDHKQPGDRYKDFFGDIEFEEDDNESISGEMTLKDSLQVGKTGLNECRSAPSERFDVKNSEQPRQPENCPRVARAPVATPPLENGPGSEHPTATDNPLVNEEWVLCDKCGIWRLLPLDTNPKSLPDKWICRMLTWLPGMNRCNIPEDVTTAALRALYHPAPVPAAVPSSVRVTLGDARNSEECQNVAGQNRKVGRKKKHGSGSATYSTDVDVSTHSSNSRKKNLPASGKNSSLNRINPSPVLDARVYHQQIQQTNGDIIDKLNDDNKDGSVSHADKGINLKIRSQRESDLVDSRASKRIKGEELRDDENWASDNGRGYNSDLAINSSRNGRVKYTNRTDPRGHPKESTVSLADQDMPAPSENLLHSSKSDDKKRKLKEYRHSRIKATPPSNFAMCENGHQKEKKARITNSHVSNSSSSKVSGSHKNKTSTEDVKGSPVESVSSSPLRLPNHKPDKVKSTRRTLVEKGNGHNSGSLTVASSRKFSGIDDEEGNDRIGIVEKNSAPPASNLGTYASDKRSSNQWQVEEKILNNKKLQNNGSHSKKSGKQPSSHSKDKSHTSGFDVNTDEMKASDTPLSQDKSNIRRSNLDGKSGTPGKADKFLVKKDATAQGASVENRGQKQEVIKSQDKKHKLDKDLDPEKLPKKNNQPEVKKSHSLPPLARSQGETVPEFGPKKQNGVKASATDTLDNGDRLKVSNQSKKAQNQNGQSITSRQPSPLPRESSSHAANSALKEAKDLKHLADRLKNNGSSESIGYYFQAVLKFLHGASLLESGSTEGTKQNDVAHAMHIYSSTAKLCEYCAREYEKSKDMAAAALAYKCTEVAHMRVVYSSHTSAIRDRNELQTALQVVPPGESPSSSASDVDNLNHQPITDKGPLAKVLGSPRVSGSHIISLRNRAVFLRLLNFAQEVNFAMEAARKSRIAYSDVSSRVGESPQREGVDSLKEVLDFSFQDVEGLLRLVRVAMEVIGH